MTWYENIHKIEIERTDLGPNFSKFERYEYRIITYDKENKQDTLPGYFSSLFGNNGAKVRAKEISEIVNTNTSNNCVLNSNLKIVNLDELPLKEREILESRVKDKNFRKRINIQGRIYENKRFGGKDFSEK